VAITGLPDAQPGVTYIVSGVVAARIAELRLAGVMDRTDVYCPGTGPQDGAIRVNGLIAAVTRIIQA